MARDSQRLAVFHPEFIEDLRHWVEVDRRAARRLLDLVEAALKEPFSGIGKPEPLKYLGADIWSRRLTQEHRCVYLVKGDRIDLTGIWGSVPGIKPLTREEREFDERELDWEGKLLKRD